jgi:heme oxygenase
MLTLGLVFVVAGATLGEAMISNSNNEVVPNDLGLRQSVD